MNIPQSYLDDLCAFIERKHPSKEDIAKEKVRLCKEHNLKRIPTDIQILLHLPFEKAKQLRSFLQTKPIRTASGVVPIALMTRPERCPHGVCTYCPGGPGSVFGDVPQSYTGKEPSTMRSIRGNYDPYLIVINRIEQFIVLGHEFDKCDVIIQGGTFCALDKAYQEEFVTLIFKAMNDFSKLFFEGDSFDYAYFKDFF
jgi:elongator complex protein 3